ncbi:MAG: PQQ-binding-like beta-propeller repeat protein [Phycisphaerales bacterium]|nr:MAG: PQQ-binding-like beta-propeller repeat protein [Phycisphaerales bacterium]
MVLKRFLLLAWPIILILGVGSAAAPGESGALGARAEPPANRAEFSVLHFADVHVSPHLLRTGAAGPPRGNGTIRWICEQAAAPQKLTPFGYTAPAPAFAFATGDLTEYGVIDDTWDVFLQAFRDLPCPMYVTPGNHDNTWVAMYRIMRKRHGGESYSFDKFGCHFACISSASPQEPVPTIDAKTRAWLKADLDRTPAGTPIFIAMHHPPDSGGFATPAEVDTLIDMLKDYNVVLILYGHGHGTGHRDIQGISGVMGGSTFGSNAGYGILSVVDGMLRYAYRHHRDPQAGGTKKKKRAWTAVLEKPLPRTPPSRLLDIARPTDGFICKADTIDVDLALRVSRTPTAAEDATVDIQIDGQTARAARRPSDSSDEKHHRTYSIAVGALTAGAHLLTAQVTMPDGTTDRRTRVFRVHPPSVDVLWQQQVPAAIKAGLVIADDLLIVARNDGAVIALDKTTGAQRWRFDTGGEVLGTPAWSGDTLVVGSGDGKVYALDKHGKQQWAFDAGSPVYGWPLIDPAARGTVFIGDNSGHMHALNLTDGKPRWTFRRADYGIESKPALWKDMLVFGAWDGYLYAVARDDGELRYKSLGPRSSEGKGVRYWAPADCGPVVIDDVLFVCDRGYRLGTYSAEGKLVTNLDAKASGIGPAQDGRSLYVRTTDNRISKLDRGGHARWDVDIPAGRFPIPPTEHEGRVYVCSNGGLLSVLDATDGKLLWQYQATPGFYVLAPTTVDSPAAEAAGPVCYVAGMDGSLTAVRYRQNTRSTRQGM